MQDNPVDEAAMVEVVASGGVDALVQDKSVVEYYAATNCSFVALPEPFHVWDLAIGYNNRMRREIIDFIDNTIQHAVDEDSLFERLQAAFIGRPSACDDGYGSSNADLAQITMAQVARADTMVGGCNV